MSSGKCFKEGCTSKVYGKCDCEGVTLFCKKHFSKHAKLNNSKNHRLIILYFKPEEEIKLPIIEKLTKLKKDIKICRADTIANANEIIKKFKTGLEKYIDQINEVEERCDKMIKILLSGEKVLDIASEDDMESALKLKASDIQHMSDWEINTCYLDYKEIKEAINKIFKISFIPFRQQYRDDTACLNELSFFRHNSKDFATVNLNTFQVSSTATLPIQESMHGYSTSCILPDKTYFYCCNNNSSSGYTFTIDKDKNVKQLQNSKINTYVDPIFYNNFIYLIGGTNKLAERYDFNRNVWESMAPITQNLNLQYGCNVLYNDLILITSCYMQKILIYSISQNSYQDVQNLVLNINYHKLMLRGNNRIYVFEKGGRTFESAENNISSWTQLGNNSISDLNQSSVVHYKDSLFFIAYSSQLWKFDLSSKQLSLVATI